MRKIIFTRPDGGVSVVHPVRSLDDSGLSDAQIEQRALSRLPLDAIDNRFIDDVPTDRHFRDAWEQSAGAVKINMPKAKEIHRQNLRYMRKPLMEKLDTDFMKALEDDDKPAIAAIKNKKQQLRDATQYPAIDAAVTPDDLKSAIPPILQ